MPGSSIFRGWKVWPTGSSFELGTWRFFVDPGPSTPKRRVTGSKAECRDESEIPLLRPSLTDRVGQAVSPAGAEAGWQNMWLGHGSRLGMTKADKYWAHVSKLEGFTRCC